MKQPDRRDVPTTDELERFHDSLQRCVAGGRFYERFYERFVASDPRIPTLFARTDMEHQRRLLHHSLVLMMSLHLRDPGIDGQMREIARRHVELGIPDALYDVWLAELLGTVAECDPKHDATITEAWRAVLRRGIAFVHAHNRSAG